MAPRLVPAPLALVLGAALGYLWAERYLDVSFLGAALFGLGSYGLWGLYVDGGRWRRGLLATLLLIGVLPFGEQADTYAGFALRALTARSVGGVLAGLGIAAVPAETILMLENGVAHVDIPCSGVRSLWAGALFFLGATWVERRRLDGGWLGCGVALGVPPPRGQWGAGDGDRAPGGGSRAAEGGGGVARAARAHGVCGGVRGDAGAPALDSAGGGAGGAWEG